VKGATGSPCGSAPTKTQEPRAASEVLSTENILVRTRACAPENDDLLHGRARLCRSCGAETANDRDRICDACAEALREERAAALAERCRIYRVRYVEDLPVSVLQEMQRGRC